MNSVSVKGILCRHDGDSPGLSLHFLLEHVEEMLLTPGLNGILIGVYVSWVMVIGGDGMTLQYNAYRVTMGKHMQ